MGLINKLKELADACRNSYNITNKLTLDNMIDIVKGLEGKTIDSLLTLPIKLTLVDRTLDLGAIASSIIYNPLNKLPFLACFNYPNKNSVLSLPNTVSLRGDVLETRTRFPYYTVKAPKLEVIYSYGLADFNDNINEFEAPLLNEVYSHSFSNTVLRTLDTSNIIKIRDEAFVKSYFTKLTFPKLEKDNLGWNAFRDCNYLKCLDFHNTIYFNGYNDIPDSLECLILRGSDLSPMPFSTKQPSSDLTWHDDINSHPFFTKANTYIYVPQEVLSDYLKTTVSVWTRYPEKFKTLDEIPEEYK